MHRTQITRAIMDRVESSKTVDYSVWTIGLTRDPVERRQQHESDGEMMTQHWMEWMADSLSDAQEIESYFIGTKGMKGGTGGSLDVRKTVYVYIF